MFIVHLLCARLCAGCCIHPCLEKPSSRRMDAEVRLLGSNTGSAMTSCVTLDKHIKFQFSPFLHRVTRGHFTGYLKCSARDMAHSKVQ